MLKFKDSKEVAMNAEARAVFEALRRIAGDDGVYKVIEAEEVLERLPAEMSSAGKQQLGTVIRQLRDDGFVKVKYFTPDEYCLLTVKKLEDEAEEAPADAAAPASKSRVVATRTRSAEDRRQPKAPGRVSVFLMAFFGSALGGMIVTAIAIILQKFAV